MAETLPFRPVPQRAVRWGGAAVLALSLGFIGRQLWRLDPGALAGQASLPLAGAMTGGALLFAGADHLLARGWQELADPQHRLDRRTAGAIYGRGVLLKYLPGSVFQYVSRQLGGAGAGLEQARLAKASLSEVGLHVVSSMSVAATCLSAGRQPLLAGGALALVAGASWLSRRPLLRALACQIGAFSAFAGAGALLAGALLPAGGIALSLFAALFLLAWLAGFVVPIAPGGIGVREAALLALAGPGVAAGPLLLTVLALRIASVLGDLSYGLIALAAGRRG